MKLVLLVHQSSEMYGSDRVLFNLAEGIHRSGVFHPVVVLPGIGPLYDALLNCGIEVHLGEVAKISRAVFTPRGLLRLVWQAFKAIGFIDQVVGQRHVAVVHSNTLAVLSGAVWCFFRRKKHLWHVHEIIVSPKLVSKAFPRLVRWFSDRVMSNSTLTERWLLSEQPELASRSVVVMNGLPPIVRPPCSVIAAFRESIGAVEDNLIVTLAGRINRMKGQGLLIDAAVELKRRGVCDSIIFLIVGGPAPGQEDLPEQLKKRVEVAGLSEKFRFIPFVDDVWPVWFSTDIAVVPSTEPESFGMVAIEAMAAEVPVVAAAHGGILDIVVDDETGILFPPRDAITLADAIANLASDKSLRMALGRAGAKRQRELFSVQSQVRQTINVYEEMI